MPLPFYLYKDFIQVLSPVTGVHTPCPTLLDLVGKWGAKPMPPVPYRFITYVHASFMQEVFYIPKWKRKSHIKYHCKLDDLRTDFLK